MPIRNVAPMSFVARCVWVPLGLLWLAVQPIVGIAAAPQQGFVAGIKQNVQKLTGGASAANPAGDPVPADDPISLQSPAKPSAKLYVAVARLYEQADRLDEAEKNYRAALQQKPNDLVVMLDYARLLERMNRVDEAISMYQRAAKAHPREAAVPNNLGLCYARQGRLEEAVASLNRAIALQPKNVLYRNNIATVLVEMGRMQEAYSHLRAVHSEAASYYNLGYLLNKKGRKQDAISHFAAALRADPTLTQAQQWLQRLQSESAGVAGRPPSAPTVGKETMPPVVIAPPSRGPSPQQTGEQLRIGSRPLVSAPEEEYRGRPAVSAPTTGDLGPQPPSNQMPRSVQPPQIAPDFPSAGHPPIAPPSPIAQQPTGTRYHSDARQPSSTQRSVLPPSEDDWPRPAVPPSRSTSPADAPLPPLPPEPPGVIRLPPISANGSAGRQAR